MKTVKRDILLAGKAAAGAAAAGVVRGLVLTDDDVGNITFDEDEVDSVFTDHGTGTKLFLDKFSEEAMWRMMEEQQIPDRIRARGIHTNLRLSFDLSDPFVHKMYVHSSAAEEPLCELFLRIFHNLLNFHAVQDCAQVAAGSALIKSSLVSSAAEGELRFLSAEWMLLQDPSAPIDGKMLLPGQRFPGLGVANQFGELLLQLGKELSCDALINRPLYFHNALLYASTHAFLNPEVEGRFLAIVRDVLPEVKERGLSAVSQGIRCGVLKHVPSNRTVTWAADEQTRPISPRMRRFLESEEYAALAKRHCPEMDLFHLNMATVFHNIHGRDSQTSSYENLSSIQIPPTHESHPISPPTQQDGGLQDSTRDPKIGDRNGSPPNPSPSVKAIKEATNEDCKRGGEDVESSRGAHLGVSGNQSGKGGNRSGEVSGLEGRPQAVVVKNVGCFGLGSLMHELVGKSSQGPLRDSGKVSDDVVQSSERGGGGGVAGSEAETGLMGGSGNGGGWLDNGAVVVLSEKREGVVFAMDWNADLDDLATVEGRIKGGVSFREVAMSDVETASGGRGEFGLFRS